jgi:hypothetical protein
MKSALKNFVVFLAVVGVARIACGGIIIAPTLSISDGVHPSITITDNLTGDLNSAFGEVTMSTTVGVWTVSISTGVTAPALGSFTNPVMDLVIQASSTGAGSLTYTFSEIGFSHAPGTLNSTVSGQVISGAPATIDYTVFGNSNNLVGALTSPLSTTGTIPLPALTSDSGSLAFTSLFSLSQVVQVNASAATSVSIDASLNVVPEPSTVMLTFLGLASLVGGLARRRRSLR